MSKTLDIPNIAILETLEDGRQQISLKTVTGTSLNIFERQPGQLSDNGVIEPRTIEALLRAFRGEAGQALRKGKS